MKQAVHDYLIACLGTVAVTRAFEGEDTSHIKDAKEAIDNAISGLDNMYEKDVVTKKENEAR